MALNNRAIPINNTPITRPIETTEISSGLKVKKALMFPKLVVPVKPYTIEDPNNNKPDEKAPNIKYLSRLLLRMQIGASKVRAHMTINLPFQWLDIK